MSNRGPLINSLFSDLSFLVTRYSRASSTALARLPYAHTLRGQRLLTRPAQLLGEGDSQDYIEGICGILGVNPLHSHGLSSARY